MHEQSSLLVHFGVLAGVGSFSSLSSQLMNSGSSCWDCWPWDGIGSSCEGQPRLWVNKSSESGPLSGVVAMSPKLIFLKVLFEASGLGVGSSCVVWRMSCLGTTGASSSEVSDRSSVFSLSYGLWLFLWDLSFGILPVKLWLWLEVKVLVLGPLIRLESLIKGNVLLKNLNGSNNRDFWQGGMLYRLDRQVRLFDWTETGEAVFIANFLVRFEPN